MEVASEWQALDAEAEVAQLQEILDLSLKAANDPGPIWKHAAAREAEYKRRREDALRRAWELRIELKCLEAEKAKREASGRDIVTEEEAPSRKERRTETYPAARRNSVYDTKSPLSYGLEAEAWPDGFKMPKIARVRWQDEPQRRSS